MAGEVSRENGCLGGRPKGTESESTRERRRMRRRWMARVAEKADEIMDAHLDLALGIWTTASTPGGQVIRVYKRPPNPKSLRWVTEHLIGKAPRFEDIKDLKDLDEQEEAGELDDETASFIQQALIYAMPNKNRTE